jgi:hypothetical protein
MITRETFFVGFLACGATIVAFGAIEVVAILEVAVLAGACVRGSVFSPETQSAQVASGAECLETRACLTGDAAKSTNFFALVEEMRPTDTRIRD